MINATGTQMPFSPNSPLAQYRDIEGWPGYAVGSDGTVWSQKRTPGMSGWRMLRPGTHRQGYLLVVLNNQGYGKTHRVHQLVAASFIGQRPLGMEVRHLDGNPKNNNLSNLEYGTKSQNARDAMRHGKHPCLRSGGEGNPRAKLNKSQVAEIRRLHANGNQCPAILRTGKFPVSLTTIQRIVNNKLWMTQNST